MKTASLLFCTSNLPFTLDAQDRVYAIKAARLFDGVDDRLVEPGLVVVSGGEDSVRRRRRAGRGHPDRPLRDPHAAAVAGWTPTRVCRWSSTPTTTAVCRRRCGVPLRREAIRATVNARKYPDGGLRHIRDAWVGAISSMWDCATQSMPAWSPGPRMLVAVHALTYTGGHCDDSAGFRFDLFHRETGPEDGVINSADQARYAVRSQHQVRRGT